MTTTTTESTSKDCYFTREVTQPRVSELRARVRLGNDRTMAAWREAINGNLSQEQWVKAMVPIDNAMRRLDNLCTTLIATGGDTCLYDTPRCRGKDISCFCCPSKIPHWREPARQERMV